MLTGERNYLTGQSKRVRDKEQGQGTPVALGRSDFLGADQNHAKINTNGVSFGYQKVAPEDKRRLVDQQFDAIARRYDLADRLLSFGLDSLWRRLAVRRLAPNKGDRVLDLCGGTADLAILAARDVAPEGTVTICDINSAMMKIGQEKAKRSRHKKSILWVRGDAETMCFADNTFDAVTVGFGVRNFVHLERGIGEIFRVLKNGGKFMILEFSVPRSGWIKSLYESYSFKVMPFVGKLVTDTAEPFKYLAESIRVFPAPEAVKATLEALGFKRVTFQRLTDGIAVVYLGEKER